MSSPPDSNDNTFSPRSSQQQNDDENNNDSKEVDCLDDEGLKRHYDVIVCGTSLVASILAAALARAGQSVLQCDGNEYYGELDAVWTLPYVVSQQQNQQSQRDGSPKNSDTIANDDDDDSNNVMHLSLSPQGSLQSLVIHSMASSLIASSSTSKSSSSASSSTKQREMNAIPPVPIQAGTRVVTPYGNGTVLPDWSAHNHTGSLPIALSYGATLFVSLPQNANNNEDNDDNDSNSLDLTRYLDHECHIVSAATAQARQILQPEHSNRQFALDCTPTLLYTMGSAVNALLTSQVSDYLEFKSLEGLWLYTTTGHDNGRLERVPCSKNDVFTNSRLTPLEKRRLMKFLQLAHDYSVTTMTQAEGANDEPETEITATMETDHESFSKQKSDPVSTTTAAISTVQSLNERFLNQGRSLSRPQNKAVLTDEMKELQDSIQKGEALEDYLRDKQKLSPALIQLIRYALALDWRISSSTSTKTSENTSTCVAAEPLTVRQGLESIGQLMQSLGKFGATAFLVPLYGSGELPQAFCRSAAVYGATQLLRRAARKIVIQKQNVKKKNNDDAAVATSFVNGVEIEPGPRNRDENNTDGQPLRTDSSSDQPIILKRIKCSHVIVPKEAFADTSNLGNAPPLFVWRRISILRGKPVDADAKSATQQQQRHIVIFPPGSVNEHHQSTIHGLLVDEGVNVAPHPSQSISATADGNGACTVLHLTTTVLNDHAPDDSYDALFKKVIQIICGDSSEEIFQMTFRYEVFEEDQTAAPSNANGPLAQGLHIIHRGQPCIACDAAFDQSKRIFSRICPNVPFLTVADVVNQVIEERLGKDAITNRYAEEDTEDMVLSSAIGMIQGKQPKSSDKADTKATEEK